MSETASSSTPPSHSQNSHLLTIKNTLLTLIIDPQTSLYRRRGTVRRTPPLRYLSRFAEVGEDGLGVAAVEGVGVVGTHFCGFLLFVLSFFFSFSLFLSFFISFFGVPGWWGGG